MKAAIAMFVAIAFASGEENHGQVTITTVNIDETMQEMEEDIPEFPVWKEKSEEELLQPGFLNQHNLQTPETPDNLQKLHNLPELTELIKRPELIRAGKGGHYTDVTFSELNNCQRTRGLLVVLCDSELSYKRSTDGESNRVTVELGAAKAVAHSEVLINGIPMDRAIAGEGATNLIEMILQAYNSTTKESKTKGSSNESSEGSKTVKILSATLHEVVNTEKPVVTQEKKDLMTIYGGGEASKE